MSAEWGSCAAFGCPMLGSFGVSGKWYCCCHFRASTHENDSITAILNNHRHLVDASVRARMDGEGYRAIKEAEDALVLLIADRAQHKPRGTVIGPTHAMQHYTERREG